MNIHIIISIYIHITNHNNLKLQGGEEWYRGLGRRGGRGKEAWRY
jgi:hypothetical protein